MKFYNRSKELKYLFRVNKLANQRTQLTVLTGRRRVGKTELVKYFLAKQKNRNFFYFFIAKKRTRLLLQEFSAMLAKQYPILTAEFTTWEQFFKFIFEISRKEKIIIVFDEFQNFKYIDSSVFSILQKYIDQYKNKSKLNLIVIGSIFTLMEKIFYNSKEPLFGRANHKLLLNPFSANEVRKILLDNKKNNFIDLVSFYTVFGGIPKYYNDIDNLNIYNKKFDIILKNLIFNENGLLKREGFDLVADEFGRNYQTYFSILQSVAVGKTKTSEIANNTGIPVNTLSQYLEKLVFYYKLIDRRMPLLEEKTKKSRYKLNDQFLTFWFRYLYKNWSMAELNNFEPIISHVKKNISALYGITFETIIKENIVNKEITNFPIKTVENIGSWWSRQEAEIDVLAVNKEKRQLFIGECKLNNKRVTYQLGIDLQKKGELIKWQAKQRNNFFGIFTVGKIDSKVKDKLNKIKVQVWEIE